MRVAYFSPMPPERSGIADYSELLLPALRRRVDVAVVRRGRKRPPRGTDVCLYHVGNNPEAHGWIVEALRRRPGVVVLHDFVLHHLVAGLTIGRGDGHGYLDAMEREGGVVGRLLGHAVLDKRIPPLWESRPEEFHLAGEVLSLASGLIVHSRYVEERARAAGFDGPVWCVPHPAWPVPESAPAEIEGGPLFGAFGNVNANKRVPQLLEAFARVRRDRPGARLLLVGATSPGFDLDRRLQRLGLDGEGLVLEGYVGEDRLWALMAACDAVVSLRAPTMGETSGIAVRALLLGKPLVVSDVGWFSELPGDVALKVAPDDEEAATLAAALSLLAGDETARRAMGEAARAYAVREHGVERVAELYASALEQAAGGRAVSEAVLAEVAEAAAVAGIDAASEEAGELARRLAEVRIAE
jgi:glycosyltransferase involved in cell wall biosynthesis